MEHGVKCCAEVEEDEDVGCTEEVIGDFDQGCFSSVNVNGIGKVLGCF